MHAGSREAQPILLLGGAARTPCTASAFRKRQLCCPQAQAFISRRPLFLPPLVPILAHELRLELEMWVVMHEVLRTTARAKLMFDHLVAGLARYVSISVAPAGHDRRSAGQ